MRAKSMLLLTLALGCGLVASIGITQVMAHRDGGSNDPGEKQEILIAKRDILMGESITDQIVGVDSRPVAYVPVGAFATAAEVVGRRARTLIPASTPITEPLLLPKGAGDQLASSGIPRGKRLSTVRVEAQSAAGNLIRPGDCVDVLLHVKADASRGIVKTTTRTILQDVRVYAVNDMWDLSTTGGEKSLTAKTISLLVSPENAELLALASAMGDISLVLRSPEDKEVRTLAGRDPQELFGLPTLSGDSGGERPDPTNPLKDLIASKPAPPAPAPKTPATAAPATTGAAPAEEPKTFTVRVLSGSQVTDVILEAPATTPEPSQTGRFDLWKIISSLPATPAATIATPPAMPPAVGTPGDQPAPESPTTGDHKTQDGKKVK